MSSLYRPNWFVGLPVPAGDWLPDITRETPSELRMFTPPDLHLTVAFLGLMHPASKLDIMQVMDTIRFTPFTISFGSLRALPSERNVSALSFELVRGHDEAARLIETWRTPLLERAGAKPDDRPPLPHITIARPQRNSGVAARRVALAWAATIEPPEVELTIDRIALYTWAMNRRERLFDVVYERTME
jgi:2'-5' RNA ligase